MVKSKHTVILYSMLILIMNLLQRRVRYMGFDYKTIMKTRGIRARAVAVPLGGGLVWVVTGPPQFSPRSIFQFVQIR